MLDDGLPSLPSPEPQAGLRPVILCANEYDAVAIREAGFKSVRVLARISDLFVAGSDEIDPALSFFNRFVLAFSRKQVETREQVAMRLGDESCRWVPWPDGINRASEMLDAHGAPAIRSLIENARPMWTDEICVMSDVPDDGPQQTFKTGFDRLDELGIRLVRPAFMTVVGPYGSGKSVLLRQLICNLYRRYGWRTLLTSFEEKIKPRYQRDLRRHLMGVENIDTYGEVRWHPLHPSTWTDQQVARCDEHIEHGFRFLRRKRGVRLTKERLIDRIAYAVRVYGLEVVVIDPLNEIDHEFGHGENQSDYYGRFIMDLKQLGEDYNLLTIVCVHPPKGAVERRVSSGSILTLNDAAGTGNFGNKSDIGWCVWRPGTDDDAPTYLNIDKIKDHEVMGQPTAAKLVLDKGLGRFNIVQTGYEIFDKE